MSLEGHDYWPCPFHQSQWCNTCGFTSQRSCNTAPPHPGWGNGCQIFTFSGKAERRKYLIYRKSVWIPGFDARLVDVHNSHCDFWAHLGNHAACGASDIASTDAADSLDLNHLKRQKKHSRATNYETVTRLNLDYLTPIKVFTDSTCLLLINQQWSFCQKIISQFIGHQSINSLLN